MKCRGFDSINRTAINAHLVLQKNNFPHRKKSKCAAQQEAKISAYYQELQVKRHAFFPSYGYNNV